MDKPKMTSAADGAASEKSDNAGDDAALVMAEVDLLPAWYGGFVRRRRHVRVQAGITVGLLVVMGTVLILRQENVSASRRELQVLQEKRLLTDGRLDRLRAQEARLAGLSDEASAYLRAGLPVEVTRVLADVEANIAPTTALLSLTALTESATPSVLDLAQARKHNRPPPGPTKVMRFTLAGVASTSAEPLRLHRALLENPLLRRDETRLVGVTSDTLNGKPVKSFVMSFAVDLLPDGVFDAGATP